VRKICWGLIFLFFNININGISIMPAFVGYTLIYMGIEELGREERAEGFYEARPWAYTGAGIGALTWLPIVNLGLIGSVLAVLIELVVTYHIAEGTLLLCGENEQTLKLQKAWKVMAVGVVLGLALGLLNNGLGVIAVLVGVVASLVYLAAYNRCMKILEEL
jgi:hypothetical protein